MSYRVSPRVLDSVWTALREPARPNFVGDPRLRAAALCKTDWVERIGISDLLEDYDTRIHGVPVVELAGALGRPFQLVYSVTGRKTQRSFSGWDRLRTVDAAALMIDFERLGFEVDPAPMVDQVLPSLKGLRLMTDGELTVLQFHSMRHKIAPLELVRDIDPSGWGHEQRIVTPAGYKVIAMFDAAGDLWRLTAFAPRYRRRPEPVLTRCAACGYRYLRGDPDDSREHRLVHRKRIRILEPQVHPRALAALEAGWQGTVDATSPTWMQGEIYARAAMFKREEGYDFVQWSPNGERGRDVRGFLFVDRSETERKGAIQGACCFRWREFRDLSPCWSLDWIWLAPPVRRQGILSRHWPEFLASYGQFDVARPLSDAMEAFLAKLNGAAPSELITE